MPSIWLPGLAHLLFAAGLVAWVRWLATRATYPRAIDVIYVLAGVAAVLILPLTDTKRVELHDLRTAAEGLMLRKAHAAALLRWRGHTVPRP